ncbi:MAG: 3-keto-5-aminohexanoate cleavage protein, partial [Desulfomonilaceae bacterium]
MNKRIITAAITGSIHTPSMSPHLPVTPDEIVEEAVRAFNAGAAVAHIHARDPQTGVPSSDVALYQEIVSKVKSRCNIVLCITTGGGLGMTTEQRVKTISILKPELASCNFGSLNFALFHALDSYKEFKFPWEREYLAASENAIFPNTFQMLREMLPIFQQNETQPELEIYDTGMINNAAFMLSKGLLKRPVYIQFVMGILGGIQPTPNNLLFMYNTAKELIG